MGLLDWAMPLVQAATSVMNYIQQDKTNQQNLELQNTEWAREDNSYQRKVADLKAAGLNPALALGGGSPSSLAVRVAAPQFDQVDMSSGIRANLAKQQIAMSEVDQRLRIAEARKAEAEATSAEAKSKFDTLYWDRNWQFGEDLGRQELTARADHARAASEEPLTASARRKLAEQQAEMAKFTMGMMSQFGEPGSLPQMIRGALGGNGGLLDLWKAIR